ncbi:hypothetical protein [Rhizobium rhizogenes]|uniref:hypothetical protein n=1 Tax=Rhizobium rhizogenes TaxID=359 RepID=UPI001573A3E5|nr:hypothetical protein [Rhizobium rhizogenes]NTI32862.1 hypothetical protein [Rhizobium rhizogenes]
MTSTGGGGDVAGFGRHAGRYQRARGPKLDVKRVSRQEILRFASPDGSRFKGYKSF